MWSWLLVVCSLHFVVVICSTSIPLRFDFVGPFLIGKTEVDGDPLAALNCSLHAILSRQTNCPQRFLSEIADGGYVGWSRLPTPAADGAVTIQWPMSGAPIDHNSLVQALSKLTVLEFGGWAVATFSVRSSGLHSIHCTPVHTFYVDGVIYHGDIYRHNTARVLTALSSGAHSLWIRIRAKQTVTFTCNIAAVSAKAKAIKINGVYNEPDIVEGELPLRPYSYVSFAVQNVGEHRLSNLTAKIHSKDKLSNHKVFAAVISTETFHPFDRLLPYATAIAPLQPLLVPVAFTLTKDPTRKAAWWKAFVNSDTPCLSFMVSVTAYDTVSGAFVESNKQKVGLRCRQFTQSVLFSHVDADGAITNAAFIRPQSPCQRACPVVLSLCGVGATARSQADSHKYQAAGDKTFTFGFDGAWVVSPFREGAHNGEGTGFHTPFSALSYVARHAAEPYSANEYALVVVGHSRGGHHVYTITQHHPSAVTAIMSAGGYGDREEYGDANILFDVDVQMSFMPISVRAILENTIVEYDNYQSAANLVGIDSLIRVGGADRTVSPFFARRMARVLSANGVNVTYDEVRGQGHWWWDTKTPSDGGVMHDLFVRTFIADHFAANKSIPQSFTVVSFNPATFTGNFGVRILQMHSRVTAATIRVQQSRMTAEQTTWRLHLNNVRRFTINLTEATRHAMIAELSIIIQSTTYILSKTAATTRMFCQSEAGSWSDCSITGSAQELLSVPYSTSPRGYELYDDYILRERSPSTSGPARSVWASPFVIIYGSDCSRECQRALFTAAMYLSTAHMHTAATSAPMIRDDELPLNEYIAAPVNVIVVGGPDVNSWARFVLNHSPNDVRFNGDQSITVGECEYEHPAAIATLLSFNINSRPMLAFMVTATHLSSIQASAEHLLFDQIHYTFSSNIPLTRAPFGNLFPDYMVIGSEYRGRGYGGILALGFWSSTWKTAATDSYQLCTHPTTHLHVSNKTMLFQLNQKEELR